MLEDYLSQQHCISMKKAMNYENMERWFANSVWVNLRFPFLNLL